MKNILKTNQKQIRAFFIVLFWLFLWQAASFAVGNPILLVDPLEVLKALLALLPEADFWRSIAMSFGKISVGFLAAFFSGILVGWLAFSIPVVQDFLAPVIAFMKSVPVASFVILALIWMGSANLSILIAFLVVFPMIYVNTIAGLKSTDRELLEMAAVFQITGWRKIRGLYWPALLPFLTSSCKTALGMSWKSGIAAEVIGVPEHTIGEQLYLSKIYLSTAELFAWTLVIILASEVFEKGFLWFLSLTENRKLMLPQKNHLRRTENGKRILVQKKRAACTAFGPDRESIETNSQKPSVHIQDLSKAFDGQTVLNHLHLALDSAQPNCIMGLSGSGKTTFFKLLLGLEAPDSGEILVEPMQKNASVFRSKHLYSAVFQENRLCEGFSAIDNIRLAVPELSRRDAAMELSRILPAESLDRPVSTLSGGMKRRVAIVRALLSPADIIIMDEPFTGLDEETKENVIRYILEKTSRKLLILSTHQEEDVKLLDGRLVPLS